MAKIDLKDAYFMIPIAQEKRDFQWQDHTYQGNATRTYFLSSAPWVLTKTKQLVVAILRKVGVRLIINIDDILIMAGTKPLLSDHMTAVLYLLENLGFVIDIPESEFPPTQGSQSTPPWWNSSYWGKRQNLGRQNPAGMPSIGSRTFLTDQEDKCGHPGHSDGSLGITVMPLGSSSRGPATTVLPVEAKEEPMEHWNGRSMIAHNSFLHRCLTKQWVSDL